MKLGGTRTQQMFAPNWRCLWHGEAVSTAVNGDFYVGSNNVFFHSPEASVAAFKEMLQTNPIELYYQRTDDPSFIQPDNGFFGAGQQTVKMESLNHWSGANLAGAGIDTEGGVISSSNSDLYYAKVEIGKTYTFKSTIVSGTGNTVYGFAPAIPVIGGDCTYNVQSYTGWANKSFTATDEYFCLRLTSAQVVEDVMLVEGTTVPTSYSSYATPQTRTTTEILPSATSKLNMQGGNDNKDCDWVFNQLDGTETGWNISSGTGWVRFYRTFDDAEPGSVVTSTHFKYHSSNNEPGIIRFGSTTKQCYLYPNLDIDSVAKFQAWLAANKPIIAYKLATSVKSTVQTAPFDIPKKTTYVLSSQADDGEALGVNAVCVEE